MPRRDPEVERERSLERLAPLSVVTFAIALASAFFLGFVRTRLTLGFLVAAVGAVGPVLVVTAFARALDGWSIGARADDGTKR